MNPDLSVVLVAGPRRGRAAECLASLLGQEVGDRLEVVVVDLAAGEPLAGVGDPRVRVLDRPAETTFAAARTAGVDLARGEIVAFLEEHCLARPGWAKGVLRAYAEGPWAGVGTRVESANPGQGRSDITGLLAYHHFYEPLESGEVSFLPGHNASFRRSVLVAYRGRLGRLLRSDIVFHRRLRADGHRLYATAQATIAHRNEVSLRSRGRGIGLWYRLYGAASAEEFAWTPARRVLSALACLAMPVYYSGSALRAIALDRPRHLGLLLRHPVAVGISGAMAGVGMAAGLLRGAGDAEARFSRFELEEWRGEPPERPGPPRP